MSMYELVVVVVVIVVCVYVLAYVCKGIVYARAQKKREDAFYDGYVPTKEEMECWWAEMRAEEEERMREEDEDEELDECDWAPEQ